jgi:hypothetical protein
MTRAKFSQKDANGFTSTFKVSYISSTEEAKALAKEMGWTFIKLCK